MSNAVNAHMQVAILDTGYLELTFVLHYVFLFAALFGEGPPERRDRLRKLLSELGNGEVLALFDNVSVYNFTWSLFFFTEVKLYSL